VIEFDTHISGLQRAQAFNAELVALLEPGGASGEIVRHVTLGLQRHAIAYTHVDTGALRASHRVEVSGLNGLVYLDPNARNPRTQELTSEYGVYEHERGGEHAFYDRAVEHADALIDQASGLFLG
jgi:hypothetical protein